MPPPAKTFLPRKRFGQNFLVDEAIIAQIIHVIAPKPSDHLVEIGPGLGAMTVPLLAEVGHMDVIELDRDLIPMLLAATVKHGKLRIHQADALKFDLAILADKAPLRVVGNLPYNISTPLIFHLLDSVGIIEDMTFMLQKEVVARLSAVPNTRAYGRLSVMVQYFAKAELLLDISPEAFNPKPKVMSAIVHLKPHKQLPHPVDDETLFADIVRHAFSQRRKTLKNGLKAYLTADTNPKLLGYLDEYLSLRPENLSVADFVKISNYIGKYGNI